MNTTKFAIDMVIIGECYDNPLVESAYVPYRGEITFGCYASDLISQIQSLWLLLREYSFLILSMKS